ncbi:peroxisomal bifunctional enzyme isoform X1 [Brienomyrus brachyistius]|uniref:peroxisomal bifunctional enzyme isoform X1 n=2 Tax=Brienomyrus brachyistius TaxID=42636 RepID=UPI0020B1ECD3|nr:peroxisomal bifunctional enzyme isoform X1 [Brienomyrus brachyistius]
MAHYTVASPSVALITLVNPPVNALSSAVRQALSDAVARALGDPTVKAVVICGEHGKFCGGADIREFSRPMTGPALVPLIDAIEAGEKPVVAAIEGMALGGGLELALGCHYRIAHSKAQLGLPEVTLGLIPAAGGTQRLPRLIGFPAALDLIITGRRVSAGDALKLGIVDQVTERNAGEVAVAFARSVADRPLVSCRLSTWPHLCPADLDNILQMALAKAWQRGRGALAPVACVKAVQAARLPYSQGMEQEQELMSMLFASPQARALQYCFFSQRAVGKWSMPNGACWNNSTARPIRKAAVIGLGTMGRGIAVCLVLAGIPVIAIETDEKQLEAARRVVMALLEKEVQKLPLGSHLGLIHFTSEQRYLREVDLVIEAIFEDLALKKQLFAELSSVCHPDTLLCTNTSHLDVDQLATVTSRPDLVIGMHFFAPANKMKLLEVVFTSRSSPEAVATAMQLGKSLGKVSVAVANCPGFVGNRMLRPYVEQASFLLEEGATPEQVDNALEHFGLAMGAFRMSDLSGLDVGWKVRKAAGLAGPGVPQGRVTRQGYRYSPLADLICEKGRLGQKTGRGWYLYEGPGGRVAFPDPWMHAFLEEYRRVHGLQPRSIGQQEVLERCLFALINEGFRVLEDGIVMDPVALDVIYVLGYGWPAHTGGPMYYAGEVGLPKVLGRLEYYQRLHPDIPHLRPSALLRQLVAKGSPPIHKWRGHVEKGSSRL